MTRRAFVRRDCSSQTELKWCSKLPGKLRCMKFGLLNRKRLVGSHESKRFIIPICHSRVTFYCKGILDLVILSVYRGNERMENTLWDTVDSVCWLLFSLFPNYSLTLTAFSNQLFMPFPLSWLDCPKVLFGCLNKLSPGNCSCLRMLQREDVESSTQHPSLLSCSYINCLICNE